MDYMQGPVTPEREKEIENMSEGELTDIVLYGGKVYKEQLLATSVLLKRHSDRPVSGWAKELQEEVEKK